MHEDYNCYPLFCTILQVYWTGIFILPKKIIKDIEKKFNRCIWNGNIVGFAKAKISLKDLCFPKKE
jgi:hypothetical protein